MSCVAIALIFAGFAFFLGVLIGDLRPRYRKKNTRRPPLPGTGATGVQRQEVNHGNR